MEERGPFGKPSNPMIFEICLGLGIVIMISIIFWFFVSGVYKEHELAIEQEKAEKALKVMEFKLKEEEERARYQMKIEAERNAIRASQSEKAWNAYRDAQIEARNNSINTPSNYVEAENGLVEFVNPQRKVLTQADIIRKEAERKAEECTSWKNSNIIEPTLEKRRKIAELCQEE